MSAELKPCPFCGGVAQSGNFTEPAARCIPCGTAFLPLDMWNRRADLGHVAPPTRGTGSQHEAAVPELPPLPQPWRKEYERPHGVQELLYYTADQMCEYGKACIAANGSRLPERMPDPVRTVIARFSRAVEGGQCVLFDHFYADLRAAFAALDQLSTETAAPSHPAGPAAGGHGEGAA